MKKNIPGMNFEAYSERFATVHEYSFESKPKTIEQKRFQILNDSMQMNLLKRLSLLG